MGPIPAQHTTAIFRQHPTPRWAPQGDYLAPQGLPLQPRPPSPALRYQSPSQGSLGPWYVARTKSQKEAWAQANLRAQNYETFLPMLRKPLEPRAAANSLAVAAIKASKRGSLGKEKSLGPIPGEGPPTKLVPLLPRYLFVRATPESPKLGSVNSTRGVLKLICWANGSPVPVPARDMDRLFSRVLKSGEIELPPQAFSSARFAPNTPVVISDGPGRDIEAVFLEYDDDDRAKIFISHLLGGAELTIAPNRLKTLN